MKEPTYPIIVALALMLVAPSFSAFGQREERGRFEERIPLRAPQERSIGAPRKQTIRAPEQQTMVRTQTLGATASPMTPAPAEPNYAVYYRPGDLTGARYKTLEECLQVRKRAGSGECIWK